MKTLWYGGKIYTMQQEGHTAEAVLVEGDRIVAVGKYEELVSQADETVDLQGATMFPGLVDSHLHMIMHGRKMLRLNLENVTSSKEMLEKLEEAAKKLDGDQWLFAESWNENQFSDGHIPTLEELDAVYDGPMLLNRVCRHVTLANSKALQFAGLTDDSENPPGGQLGRTDGKLNGLLYENARELITHLFPTEGELEVTINMMLEKGLTGGHTEEMYYFADYKKPLAAYKRAISEKKHFRVNLLRHHEEFEKMMNDEATYDDPYIMPGAMKIFADGSFGGSTAALLAPYSDNPENSGMLIYSDEEFELIVQKARKHNEAIAVHMIGDAAAKQVIDAIEKYPAPAGKRDRLIHLCLFNEDLLARIKKLPVVVDVQPPFVPSDFPWVAERLGKDRLKYAYAWKTLLDEGIMCAGGTDAPIENIDPLLSIYTAIERTWPNASHEGYLPEQKVSRYEAIYMYTVGSAQAICREHEFGQIKEGYYADFSIFDRDLFEGPAEQLLEAKALKTVVGGRVAFERTQ